MEIPPWLAHGMILVLVALLFTRPFWKNLGRGIDRDHHRR
jgi:hypothetical protein